MALDNALAYRQLNEQEHENRRLFEEAERARAAAEDADAAKSAFLSTVSHELRTPLTSVLGFAKIIRKRLDTGSPRWSGATTRRCSRPSRRCRTT